jgi:hypothetical protein
LADGGGLGRAGDYRGGADLARLETMMPQTVSVTQDRFDPNKSTITVSEASGFGTSVRVEKILIPQLIAALEAQLPEDSWVVDEPEAD